MASKKGKRRGLQEVKEHIKKVGRSKEGPMVGKHFPKHQTGPLLNNVRSKIGLADVYFLWCANTQVTVFVVVVVVV